MASNLSMIACVGKNGELGKDGQLLFHIKEDMKFFVDKTIGHTVVMGRKTYYSIGYPLPNRVNVVISHSKFGLEDELIWENSIEHFVKTLYPKEEYFVIGGASIYEQFLPYADTIYLTEVDAEADADVYFPKFDKSKYKVKLLKEGEEKGVKFRMMEYRK